MKENEFKSGLEHKPTQCKRLLEYIEEHGSITTLQAIIKLGIINPSARVSELKAAGVDVITTIHHAKNRFNEHCRYAVYTIGKGGE